MSSGGSLASVMNIIKNLMTDDVSGEEAIFIIKEEEGIELGMPNAIGMRNTSS